jgi:hypothetical protein
VTTVGQSGSVAGASLLAVLESSSDERRRQLESLERRRDGLSPAGRAAAEPSLRAQEVVLLSQLTRLRVAASLAATFLRLPDEVDSATPRPSNGDESIERKRGLR